MTSLERVLAVLDNKEPDRVPVIAQVFGHAATVSGQPLGDYVRSGRLLAECQMKAVELYGYDAVFAVMDTSVESEALGSRLVYPMDRYPHIESYAFTKETNLGVADIPDPLRAGRMPEILEALRTLRGEAGNEKLVVGCVLGPMTLATQLIGIETALYLAIDDPESFERLLAFSTRVATRFGIAQIEAGAHVPLVFDPSASTAVVPASFFREFEFPRLKTVFDAFRKAGAAAGWLHVAGPITGILGPCAETGANIINFDYCVDPLDVINQLPSTVCSNGNIRPLDFEEAAPDNIFAESTRLVDLFAQRGRFFLSSGCEIPPGAKPENVHAMVSAVNIKGK
jgi:uroporphyrinogen decarboxylase